LIIAKTSALGYGGGHTSLTGGGPVQYAGNMHFTKSGQLTSWNNGSGHYLPLTSQAGAISEKFKSLGIDATMDIFHGR